MYCNFGVMLKDKTRHIAESAWAKAVFALAAYIVLIPILGVYGAAMGLLLSNLVEFYWVNKRATRLYDMGLQWGSMVIMLITGALFFGITFLLPVGEWLYFIIRMLLFTCLVIVFYFLPVWEHEDRRLIKAGINKVTIKLT
jgi:O-antigen/teichoic acid export membrane protein